MSVEAIKRAVEGVTPGPWRKCGGATPAYTAIHSDAGYIIFGMADITEHKERGHPIVAPDMWQQQKNASYIAAVNPAVISELLAALESLQRENEAMRQRLDAGPHGEDAIDVAESAADFLRHRAEAAEAKVKSLEEALKPFITVSESWIDEEGWSGLACQHDRIVDWFGPSDFRRARTALASTGGEHAE